MRFRHQILAVASIISLGSLLLTGCSDPPVPPAFDPNVPADAHDRDLSRYGFTAVPIEQISPQIKDNAVIGGAVVFETTKVLMIDGKVYLPRKSFLAARHPFSYTPYYTVYAVKDAADADNEKWLPACGVVAWPRPPNAISDNNVWLSYLSTKKAE